MVSGIGFLAGGAILRNGITVQGLTTAAGLWLVAAIGLCAGADVRRRRLLATVLGIIALTVLRRFEDKDDERVSRRLSLDLGDGAPPLRKVMDDLEALGAIVTQQHVEKDVTSATWSVTFDVRLPVNLTLEQVLELDGTTASSASDSTRWDSACRIARRRQGSHRFAQELHRSINRTTTWPAIPIFEGGWAPFEEGRPGVPDTSVSRWLALRLLCPNGNEAPIARRHRLGLHRQCLLLHTHLRSGWRADNQRQRSFIWQQREQQ